MAYIKLLIAVIIFVFTVTKIETKNCSKDRGSKVLSKNNGTYPEEYFEEISVVLKQKAGFEENATLSGYHLPHNYVPSITETEKGENLKLISRSYGNTHANHRHRIAITLLAFNHRKISHFQRELISRLEFIILP